MARFTKTLGVLAVLPFLGGAASQPVWALDEADDPTIGRPSSVFVFGARMTDNDWKEVATLDNVGWRDAWLAGGAVSHELIGNDYWAIEAEGHVIRHFGNNDHWEFNAVLTGRWRAFPWNEWVPTSLALGVGPSLATETPKEERARDGDSAPLLLYWMAEIEAGPPESRWSGFARLHHRSNGYGVFADRGGSNFIMLGSRYRF